MIYPNSIFNYSDDDEIIIESSDFSFEQEAPSELAWSKITIGNSKQRTEEILGLSPLKIDRNDGISIWKYWSINYNKDDDKLLMVIPWGKVYKVCFDSSNKVIDKKIELIPKEEALKIIEDNN
jgi:hypothetical protein